METLIFFMVLMLLYMSISLFAYKRHTKNLENTIKEQKKIFKRLDILVMDHMVAMDSSGNSAKGSYNTEEVQEVWNEYQDIVSDFYGMDRVKSWRGLL